ncbi:MAG TPA: phosphoenolpyruvate synthase [Thermoanaerobaculia bacterium]|nr:phosphoenolpyruvate synthase [Thermoanaerobaculia bacterium]
MRPLIRFFDEISIDDVPLVGGKNASLGEMVKALVPQGVEVPFGFATTAFAYRLYLDQDDLEGRIRRALSGLDISDVCDLHARGDRIRREFLVTDLPASLTEEIVLAYRALSARYGEEQCAVAVRSSATAEDLPASSFAGQQETFLNVRGEVGLLDACQRCFASLFTDRAIAYREQMGFDHLSIALSIGVQKMVRSDLGASGVMFTIDPETGFRDVVLISAGWGLGENVVKGTITPDEICIFKPTLMTGFRPIVQRRLGSKERKLVYSTQDQGGGTRNIPTSADERSRFSITDDDALRLARWGLIIEQHYGDPDGEPRPMDIEWAKDGESGALFILQARPETVQSRRERSRVEIYHLGEHGEPLVKGRAIGSKVGKGEAKLVSGADQMSSFQEGQVLVAEMTDPDWVPIMKRAAAIVTERGGRTCHAAIVGRELGVPVVVGAKAARQRIANGAPVTVSCAEGEEGAVYPGLLEVRVEHLRLSEVPASKTRIMMNLADPERAFELSFLPNDGVGLARMEFIVSNAIRIHPMALLRYPALSDPQAVRRIEELTAGYEDKGEYFVDRLSQGIGKIAAAFYPKEVILRLSDFKTNEYARLIGGKEFEPPEENPMLGFRGASRYTHSRYRQGFALECAAVRRVREVMGLTNLKLMVPFCRTVEEGRRVIDTLAEEGLKQGEAGLEIYVMCEIPSNVVVASKFAEIFDGFSIGSNDLTQLILGVDRDSEIVAPLFDERNEAVKSMIRQVIFEAHVAGRKIGICGQAPSDYPEFAEFLVDCGIDSLSLNPDVVVATRKRIAGYEGEGKSILVSAGGELMS